VTTHIDGVWIGDWIYDHFNKRLVTIFNYNKITNLHTLLIITEHAKSFQSPMSSRVGTCFFAKALLSNGCIYFLIENLLLSSGCCFVFCFTVVIQ
jgi:hypothetical protein